MSFTIKAQRFIDSCVFEPACHILGAFKGKSSFNKNNIKKILIIKFWALGDSVTLLPTLCALKKQYPKAQIHVLAHPRNKVVFERQPFVDKVIDFGAVNILKLFRKYDICIDAEPALHVSAVIAWLASPFRLGFSHGARSTLYHEVDQHGIDFLKTRHMVNNYLEFAHALGSKYKAEKLLPISVSEKEKRSVKDFLEKNGIKKADFVIGISPGVAESVKFRMWPAERMAKFADEAIKKYNAKIVFVDSKANKSTVNHIRHMMYSESIDASGAFNIHEASELIRNCSIFISNDSGLMHISAAMGTKTIGLFGPNTPKLWGPFGKGNISLFKPKKGCPFLDNTHPHLIPKELTREQMTCMDAISVQDVMKAVERLR